MLSALIDRAAQSGVEVEVAVNIPAETAIDSADICAAVANTLENALNACLLAREEDRKISIRADYGGQDKFTLAVENGVREKIPLGEDGLPKGRKSEEHGYGLDSVRYIAEKYSGFFVCQSGERQFAIRLVLFGGGRGERAEGGKGRNKPRLIAGIAAAEDPAEGLMEEEALEELAAALEKLPTRECDIIILHYYTGISLKEIAARMGMSYSNLKHIHGKALSRLRQWLS